MTAPISARFACEAAAAAASAVLALVTLLTREWIEIVFGVDPDGGSGGAEWLLVVGLALVAVACSLLARREWRRTTQAGAAGA
ncbi:MAG: hypothetical protein QOI73_1101 [Solirubrobacteraceae bacterium]|nr:hypothetical protein [Solirubrobacteraceae bacterium]